MYIVLLISRYLRRKLVPLFAALAVTLCTAMVIIVISVMGGFLNLMRTSAKTLSGDLNITADIRGFPHYQPMLEKLLDRPEFEIATPIIRAYGLLNFNDQILTIEVMGVDPEPLSKITAYRSTLYWNKERVASELARSISADSPELSPEWQDLIHRYRQRWLTRDLISEGMTLTPAEASGTPMIQDTPTPTTTPPTAPPVPTDSDVTELPPGMVMGIEVSPTNYRDEQGQYRFFGKSVDKAVALTTIPLSSRGVVLEPSTRIFQVVNEFKSGLYDIDANRVYVPFAILQRMMWMQPREAARFDPETGEATGEVDITAGQASEILIKIAPGVDLAHARNVAADVIREMYLTHPDLPGLRVMTWEQRHSTLLQAVEKEKGLLVILFSIISLVAIVMIAVIFYMIVLEKTRDIGILRAVGATGTGIAGIYLGYGLAVGLVGAGLGFFLGAGVVWNLNEIQDLLFRLTEFKMWDPRIYYFDRIPNQVDATEVMVVCCLAVVSSVLGALIPACLAGRLNPVEALRHE